MPRVMMVEDSAKCSGVVPKSTRASREAKPSVVSLSSRGAAKEIFFIFVCSTVDGASHPDRVVTGNEGENKGFDRCLFGEEGTAKVRIFVKPAREDSSAFFTSVASRLKLLTTGVDRKFRKDCTIVFHFCKLCPSLSGRVVTVFDRNDDGIDWVPRW